jgi:hypothetical protein
MLSSHEYLSPQTLERSSRFSLRRFPIGSLRTKEAAARFLMREFQEGVTEEAELANALEHYIEQRAGWRIVPVVMWDRSSAYP